MTASASYFKSNGHRALAWTAAIGQNRDVFGTLEAYLLEAELSAGNHTVYTRIESVDKDILDAGFHPIGIAHTHRQSNISALTTGYVRNLASRAFGQLGAGGDVTVYKVARNLQESYGSPVSVHVFLRYRGRAGTAAPHVH